MLGRKGRRILESLNPGWVLNNVRLLSLPQTIKKPSESSPIRKGKEKKKPLMKNIFLGLLEDDVIQFSNKRKFDLPSKLLEFCQLIKSGEQSLNYQDQLKNFGKCGFFHINPLLNSEDDIKFVDSLHFYEELDLDPNFSALLEIQSTFIIPAIANYGSSEQKQKYLKKLFNGEVSGAIAMSEESGGSDLSTINTTAQEGNDSFSINGEKNWITNALNADFFFVLAKVPIVNLKGSDGTSVNDISMFIVDKNSSIQLEKYDSCGLSECGIGKLTLNNHLVPASSELGPSGAALKIAAEGLKSPKFVTLVCILNQLKKVISDVSSHVNSRKQLPRDLRENELIQRKLSEVMSIAYSFESILYVTADLLDRYDMDTSLESALVQIYGFEQGMNALSICMELLGSKVYDKKFHYEKLWNDLKGLSLFGNTNITRAFASLIGLEHAGNNLKNTIVQNRNPLNSPLFAFKKMINNRQFMNDKVKLHLHLYRNFHPSLKASAEELEYCILRFQYIVEVLFSRHGSELGHRTINLNRLADIALEIYVMITVISRSSHSYCTGLLYSDQEILMAKNICFLSTQRVKKIIDDIMTVEVESSDSISVDVGSHLLNKQCYFVSHPLLHDI